MVTVVGGIGHLLRYPLPLPVESIAEDSREKAGRCLDKSSTTTSE
jgi:hypothetical protein